MKPGHDARYRDVFSTSWGWVGAVYSDRGLRKVTFPRSSRQAAALALRRAGHGGGRSRPWPGLRSRLRRYFAGKQPDLDLPLDLSPPGDFTRRVWNAARAIPYGRRVTYGELARRAGCPGGARAAGQAMSKNPVPVFVPCHRVVGTRDIGGFSGGVTMKTRLLSLEGGAGPDRSASRAPGVRGRRRPKR